MKKGFYWHCHHDTLLDYVYDYDERVKYIKEDKSSHEILVRLRLLKPVKFQLPEDLVETWQKCNKSRQKRDESWQRRNKAYQEYIETLDKRNVISLPRFIKAISLALAYQKWNKAGQKYLVAWEKYDEILSKYKDLLEELHKKECGCKEWNGKEIVFESEEK